MEEESTRNYIKLVLVPQIGQRIMPNTSRKSEGISFLNLSGNRVLSHSHIYNTIAV